jgi:hypothetical protein
MADQILRQDKSQTTSRTGKALWLQSGGAATPSTYDDEWILPDDFLSAEQARITTNEGDITSLDARVTTLEDGLTKNYDANQNTSYTFSQNADSVVFEIHFFTVSGTPVVAVGTTLAGEEIMTSRNISNGYRVDRSLSEYSDTSRTIYISISGGIVDVVIYTRENIRT